MRGRLIVFLFNFQRLDRGHRPDRFRTVIQYCQSCYVVTSLYHFTIDARLISILTVIYYHIIQSSCFNFLKFIYTYENLSPSTEKYFDEFVSKISILSLSRSQHYLLLFQFFKFETTIKITIFLLQFLPILSTIIKFLPNF